MAQRSGEHRFNKHDTVLDFPPFSKSNHSVEDQSI